MPATKERSACKGCGAEIDQPKGSGRPRIWCSDRCRKTTLYAGECCDCGASTCGDGGRASAPKRCAPCAHAEQAAQSYWQPELILTRIREWNARYGSPPTAADWNPALIRSAVRRDAVRATFDAGDWPYVTEVVRRFGSWNAAIKAAGCTPRKSGGRGPAKSLRPDQVAA